jgi:hypothetical protein
VRGYWEVVGVQGCAEVVDARGCAAGVRVGDTIPAAGFLPSLPVSTGGEYQESEDGLQT